MEQIELGFNKDLSVEEKKNVFLAVASGCFYTIHNMIPGPSHQKKKRVLKTLGDEIVRYASPKIPQIQKENMQLFEDTIVASGVVMDQILEETGLNGTHVMLNLAGFCMEELPLNKRHYEKYNRLFDLFQNATQYKDIRSGERIFTRIETELEILIAKRGGVIL
jgi:tRNA isopentenyl-2-thiomethyl-A-37 hydroxylase MiaE